MASLGRTISYAVDTPEIQTLCDSDPRLSLVIKHYGELIYTLHSDPFAHLIENIVGQMLSNKSAAAITARLYARCGGALAPDVLSRLEIVDLKGIGLSKQKAEYISLAAEFLKDNPGFFDKLSNLPDEEIIAKLTKLRGVGMWSAKMYLIFVLDRQNVLPFEDGAFQQAYKWLYATEDIKPAAIKERCTPWNPYSSIASRYMYRALDHGLTKDAMLSEQLARIE